VNWKHFTFKEFECNCGNHCNDMDAGFITMLDNLRDDLGFPFIITSGYRCPAWNDKVSSTGRTGPHTTGRAVDILASHQNAIEIIALGYQAGFRGFGISQQGKDRFIHLDHMQRPHTTCWSY